MFNCIEHFGKTITTLMCTISTKRTKQNCSLIITIITTVNSANRHSHVMDVSRDVQGWQLQRVCAAQF